jgi:hypothetical protein
VVDAVVLRGLPFYQSDRLVSLDRMGSGKAVISSFAAPDYLGACIRGRLSFKPVRTGEADGNEITSAATAAEILRGKTFVEVASPSRHVPFRAIALSIGIDFSGAMKVA